MDQQRHPPARAAGRAPGPAPRGLKRRDPRPGRHRDRHPEADGRAPRTAVPGPRRPPSWDAVQACLHYRDQLATLNPHLIVTKATRTGGAPADGSYLTRLLAPAGVTPSACRQTRIAQLVNDLDPKLTAAALGMQDSGLVRYLADNIDKDRLQRLSPR